MTTLDSKLTKILTKHFDKAKNMAFHLEIKATVSDLKSLIKETALEVIGKDEYLLGSPDLGYPVNGEPERNNLRHQQRQKLNKLVGETNDKK